MDISDNSRKELLDKNIITTEIKMEGNPTAMTIAWVRWEESKKPAGERICYDPYAVHFISPEILEWRARNPDKVKAIQEQSDRFLPGLQSSLAARVRFFDDFVESSLASGIEQLVILGAGYDTRAYRIKGLKDNELILKLSRTS